MSGRRLALRDVPLALRGAALLPAAAFAVHQLRYRLAYGSGTSHALASQGHAYLEGLAPWVVLLAGLALGATLGGLARHWAGDGGRGRPAALAGLRVWLVAAAALIAVYAGQELLEGWLATGHPGGLAGVFGDGGWWAVPVALLVGGLLALALRAAQLVERACAARRPFARPWPRAALLLMRFAPAVLPAAPAPLALAAAGRAPPRRARAVL